MNDTAMTRQQGSLRIVAGLGLAWNLFGIFRFATTEFADKAQHVAAGMTPSQAAMYADLPVWMTLAFAVGVFGGAAGCILLLLRRTLALPAFQASLIGYVILYLGDVALGVFAAFGTAQVVILTFVVLIAAVLLWYTTRMARRGTLA